LQLRALQNSNATLPPRLQNATQADIDHARAVVNQTIEEMRVRNKARVMQPLRNNYGLKPGTITKRDVSPVTSANLTVPEELNITLTGTIPGYNAPPPPLVNITQEIADAAALLAEYDAVTKVNGTYIPGKTNQTNDQSKLRHRAADAGDTSWMASITRKGTVPFGDDSAYKVSNRPSQTTSCL
jgi:hypothetical protein